MPNFYYRLLFVWKNIADDEDKQLDLIKEGNHAKIMSFLSSYKFCKKAELALIERGNLTEIQKSIFLNYQAETTLEILQHGSPEAVNFYLQHFSQCVNIDTDFVRRENLSVTVRCIPYVQLCAEAQIAFVQKGDSADILMLLKEQKIIFPKTQIEIINRGNVAEIDELLRHNELVPQVLLSLLEHKQHREIMLYLQRYNIVQTSAECRRKKIYNASSLEKIRMSIEKMLLENGNSEEIIAYCKQTNFNFEETKLLERGNHTEIMFYLSHYRLTKENEKLLMARSNDDELKLYASVWYPDAGFV